jgi:hypothetical protein
MRYLTRLVLTIFLALIIAIILSSLLFSGICLGARSCAAETLGATAKTVAEKVVHPDWLSQKALKYSFATSFVAAQSLSGMVEGYHFRNGGSTYYINSSNYHAFETARDIALIGTGITAYANLRNPHQTKWGKARRLLGTGLIARDFKEWSYKTARYHNPFDYSDAHNEHSIVYFGFRNGKLTDLYIGTGPLSGPLVDMACLAVGIWLLDWE